MSAWNEKPVVLTCAITGADVFRENNPNIPYTTQEIAESAIGAARAGATVAHLHVREDDGTPSGRSARGSRSRSRSSTSATSSAQSAGSSRGSSRRR